MDKKDLKQLRLLSGYNFDSRKIEQAVHADETGEYADGDVFLESDIYDKVMSVMDSSSSPGVDEFRGLFGESANASKSSTLRPMQQQFIRLFFQTGENLGMGFRTGVGKTRTFLEIANDWLQRKPSDFILISTPRVNLVKQIESEIDSYESLDPMKRDIIDVRDGIFRVTDENDIDIERLCIQLEDVDDITFFNEFKKKYPKFKRILISTPQKILSMLQKKEISAASIGLLVIDEGGIGSRAKTGKYATYKIYEYLKKYGKRFRVICADATPTEFEYYTEKFDIRRWYFGEDPYFANVYRNEFVKPDLSDKHKEVCHSFLEIVRKGYDRFQRTITDEVYRLAPDLRGIDIEYGEGVEPHLSAKDYKKIKTILNSAIKYYPNYEDKDVLRLVYEAAVAFYRIQLLYRALHNQTYETVIRRIDHYGFQFQKDPSCFRGKGLGSVLQLNGSQKISGSPVFQFARGLEKLLEDKGIEHPKVSGLEKLLKVLVGRKQRVLVLCSHLQTANILNHRAKQRWGLKSAVIHGSRSQRKKNLQRQQFVFESFRRGEIDVIFATSVAERGLDLPEIDAVVSYSPNNNVVEEFQCLGRMRQGGVMYTLIGFGEEGKAYQNMNMRRKFLDERARYLDKEGIKEISEKRRNVQMTKFSGKPKTKFFVKDLVDAQEDMDGEVISERFYLHEAWPPRISHPNGDKRYSYYTVKCCFADKTGMINCYYSCDSRLIAQKIYDSLLRTGPYIVNGVLKFSKRTGSAYISCRHDEKYFQEGILPCPQSDADMDNLIFVPESLDEYPLPDFAKEKTPLKKVPDLPVRRRKRKRKDVPEEQLGFIDFIEGMEKVG